MMRQLTLKKKEEKKERMKEKGEKTPHRTLLKLVSQKQRLHKIMFCESSLFFYLLILLFGAAF